MCFALTLHSHSVFVTPPGLFERYRVLMSSRLQRSVRTWVLIPGISLLKKAAKTLVTAFTASLRVTPPGFEPRSQEPESCILSVELWGRLFTANKCTKYLLRTHRDYSSAIAAS